MLIVNLKKHCMRKLIKNQLNTLLKKSVLMRKLNIEPMRIYCTLVLSKSMCYINISCRILNTRHCVYIIVKASSEYFLNIRHCVYIIVKVLVNIY